MSECLLVFRNPSSFSIIRLTRFMHRNPSPIWASSMVKMYSYDCTGDLPQVLAEGRRVTTLPTFFRGCSSKHIQLSLMCLYPYFLVYVLDLVAWVVDPVVVGHTQPISSSSSSNDSIEISILVFWRISLFPFISYGFSRALI